MIDEVELNKPMDKTGEGSLRILASCNIRHGGNDYSFVRAFRRAGHSVLVVPPESFMPRWETKWLKAARRLAYPAILAEYNCAVVNAARSFEPDLFFVFKGDSISVDTVAAARARGAVAINYYPDTGFDGYAAQAISAYDWVFTTKPAHIDFLRQRFEYTKATFVPHAFDPEVHHPQSLNAGDQSRYGCDVVFIGNISKKKAAVLGHLMQALQDKRFKIWGSEGWRNTSGLLHKAYQGTPVWGAEYAKAINGARINLGLLYEGSSEAPAGDVITARTFEVPASGGFMLHERTDEAMRYFEEGRECAYFNDQDDLVDKIRYYLSHDYERRAIAEAGRRRALTSGYSYDDRVKSILAKYWELRAVGAATQA